LRGHTRHARGVRLLIKTESNNIEKELSQSDSALTILSTELKLKQMSNIYCEILKIKHGLTKHSCKLRNRMHIFAGELEIHCNLDISDLANQIIKSVEEGITEENWAIITKHILTIYEEILMFCK